MSPWSRSLYRGSTWINVAPVVLGFHHPPEGDGIFSAGSSHHQNTSCCEIIPVIGHCAASGNDSAESRNVALCQIRLVFE